ncbi:HupE/UreJ family protein [Pseudodonghicola flavimaris]|uniref:HupE/UreJ family protein n=1 Tax=Pseudodonghicola flavimaris TaxID=3050036 RepID=A0ABT7F614_9RHOB|nr:HupE/UreJ family protein [Pseudodonghicola flavimaris]MDK3019844.1 HupE/UreJ family protein [Pseudodonghicola flavimaris]
MIRPLKHLIPALAPALLIAQPALAHLNPGEHGSFLAGATHPISGADHVLAMVCVGLWAALLGGRALWMVPAAFVGAMSVGFLTALGGLPLPFVEPVILASSVVLGLLVAVAARLPVAAGAAVVAGFALFHGHAHGAEMGGAQAMNYLAGFAAVTAALHVAGLGFGLLLGKASRQPILRGTGLLVAAAGSALALAG